MARTMRLGVIGVLGLVAASCATAPTQSRYYNSPPVRMWPILDIQDYGQPPTRETEVLWPLYESYEHGEEYRLRVFPFVWFGRKPDDRYLFVVPFYGQRRKADSHADLFFPLFSAVEGEEDIEPYALVPHLVTWVNTARERTVRFLGPLFRAGRTQFDRDPPVSLVDLLNLDGLFQGLRYRGAPGSTSLQALGLFPLWRWDAPAPGTDLGILSVFNQEAIHYHSWPVQEPERAATTQPATTRPAGKPRRAWHARLFPFFSAGREPDRWHLRFWPFFGGSQSGSKRSFSIAWPFLIYKTDAEQGDTFLAVPFGLAGYHREPGWSRWWALPIAWFSEHGDEYSRMVLPFYLDVKEGEERAGGVPLLHAWSEDGAFRRDLYGGTLVGYARDPSQGLREYTFLWPLGAYRTEKSETHARLLPFFWHTTRGDERTDMVLPPLFIRHHDQGGTDVTSFPFIWYSSSAYREGYRFTLFPVLWVRQYPDDRTVDVWPLVGVTRQPTGTKVHALLSAIGWETRPQEGYRHVHVLPFWYTREKTDWYFSAFPVVSMRRDGDFRGTSWLWPAGKSHDPEVVRRDIVAWQLLRYRRWRNGDYDLRLVHKLVHSYSKQGHTEFAVNPLFAVEEEAGAKTVSLFGFIRFRV